MTDAKTGNQAVNDNIQKLAAKIYATYRKNKQAEEEVSEVYWGMSDEDICAHYSDAFDMDYDIILQFVHSNKRQYADELAVWYANEMSRADNSKDMNTIMTLLRPKLRFFIWQFVKNDSDIDDVLHDTIEKLCIKMDTYNVECGMFTTWAFNIAKRTALSRLAEQKKMQTDDIDDHFEQIANELIDDSMERLDVEIRRDTVLTHVYSSIQAVSMDEGNLMVIEKDINRRKCREIAERYEMSENTVKTRIRAGRRRIREMVIEKHPELSQLAFL